MTIIVSDVAMACRSNCGACCIAPSINTPMPDMPHGKRAGERCVHLNAQLLCGLWDTPERPAFCGQFKAESSICGTNQREAMAILLALELDTQLADGINNS